MAFCHPVFADGSNTIAPYRITISEYRAFLESTAVTDNYNLYDPKMGMDPPMIKRHGLPGAYRYTVSKTAYPDDPITYVNRMSQARFCNWKENTKDGAKSSITETGVYDLTTMTNGNDGIGFSFQAASNASYFLSSNYNTLGISDPMLGGGESTNCMLGHMEENNSAPNNNPDSLSGAGPETVTLSSDDNNTGNNDLGGLHDPQHFPSLLDTSSNPHPVLEGATAPLANSSPITISLVTIDEPGNENGPKEYGYLGSVSTVFQMGQYDVTAEEYTACLNAVATINDDLALYDTNMGADSTIACITRSSNSSNWIPAGSDNNAITYSYAVIPGREKFPITYTSYTRSVRFCNWMENGQPIGLEGPGTTETGSFDITHQTNYATNIITNYIRDFTGKITGTNYITNVVITGISVDVTSITNARWSLPTEDQWYKAAYYKKNTVGLDGFVNSDSLYYTYGTASSEMPNNSIAGAASSQNSANYCLNGSNTMTSPPYITPVGTFEKTKSPFGLYDMSGNVDQWIINNSIRGGSWQSTNNSMSPNNNGKLVTDTGDIGVSSMKRVMVLATRTNTLGFRLVYNVPPPPESYAQFLEGIPVRLGLRFWDGLKATAHDLNMRYFVSHMGTGGMDALSWTFGEAPLLLISRYTGKDLLGALPPPFGSIGLIVLGLVGAYEGADNNESRAGFGLAIDGTARLYFYRQLLSSANAAVAADAGVATGNAAATTAVTVAVAEDAALVAEVLPPPVDAVGLGITIGTMAVSALCSYFNW